VGAEPSMSDGVPASLDASLRGVVAEAEARGGEVAIAVRHLERGHRWEVKAEEPFAAASTIKVAVLAALYEAAAEGRVRLDAPIRLRAEDQVTGSGVLQVLSPGIRLPLRDLAELMIVVSDNAATNMILERVGIDRVNALLARLGFRHSRMLRPLQVIPAGVSGTNTVAAGEYADLFAALARGQVVSWEACRRMIATLKRQQLRDALPALLPDAEGPVLGALPRWELAHKTGGIRGHQHDGGLLYLPGGTVAVAVLTRGCGTAAAARGLIARVGLALWETYGAP
jgi:beta-lactamase class A